MGLHTQPLSATRYADLTAPCRECLRWQTLPAPAAAEGHDDATTAAGDKRDWIAEVTAGWGPPGRIAYDDDRPVGHLIVAPAAYLPRVAALATAPVGSDAVVLAVLEAGSRPVAKLLVQGMAKDLLQRHVSAVEAFGRPGKGRVCGAELADLDVCRTPTDRLVSLGFTVVREHPTTPRLRLDLDRLAVVKGTLRRLEVQARRLVPEPTPEWGRSRVEG